MKVRVKLAGAAFSLRLLADCCPLTEGEGIEHRKGHYYLAHPSLNEPFDQGRELHNRAAEKLTTLNGIVRFQHASYEAVTLAGLIIDLDSGAQHVMVKAQTVRARVALAGAATVSGVPGPQQPPPVPTGIRMLRTADTHPPLRSVLDRMGTPDWTALYNVFEIMQNDVNGKVYRRLPGLSKREITLFTRSAEMHRHGIQRYDPPSHPMSFDQAQEVIRKMINMWFSDMTGTSTSTGD